MQFIIALIMLLTAMAVKAQVAPAPYSTNSRGPDSMGVDSCHNITISVHNEWNPECTCCTFEAPYTKTVTLQRDQCYDFTGYAAILVARRALTNATFVYDTSSHNCTNAQNTVVAPQGAGGDCIRLTDPSWHNWDQLSLYWTGCS